MLKTWLVTPSSQGQTQEDHKDTSSHQKGKSALAPTLTIFIVIALIAVACLYWTRRRKRFVKEENQRLEVETINSHEKDEKDFMFDRMESPPPIYTRSSSLVPSTRNSSYDQAFTNYALTAPTVQFAQTQIPSRNTSVSNLSISNARAESTRSDGLASYRSSVMIPPKTYTPFEDTFVRH